jgi:RecB family endonuclease NucS
VAEESIPLGKFILLSPVQYNTQRLFLPGHSLRYSTIHTITKGLSVYSDYTILALILMTSMQLYLGTCEVDYDGRASSHLPAGDRLVLIQPNVLTVHALDDKVNPVNYMKDATTVINGNTIRSTRTNPNESLTIEFSTIDKVVEYNGSDEAELSLTGTEEELQEELHDSPSMISDEFVSFEREYNTGAGPVDIRGSLDDEECLVEVKKTATVSAVSQLARYLKADNTDKGIIASYQITDTAQQTLNDYDNMSWSKV